MILKKCFKCREEKPRSDFYKHPEMADGRLGKCKECTKRDVIENRLKRVDYYREYDRRRFSEDQSVRDRIARSSNEWSSANPERRRAHWAVNNAVRDGRLKKSSCESCGAEDHVHGHHDDYSKPLDVRWLYAACHRQHHVMESRA